MIPRVFFLTPEIYPFSKSGGLGDVMGALPLSIQASGVPTAVITPFYGRISTGRYPMRKVMSECPVGYPWPPVTAEVYEADYEGVPVYFIRRAEYFDRRNYYNDTYGDYFDNAERFIFFCKAAFNFIEQMGEAPSVIHAQEWQTGLAPAYLHFLRRSNPFWANTASMFTIHNLAFQGRFSSRLFRDTGLPDEAWSMHGVEYHGDLNMLKGGIQYADAVTTVSPSYSREVLTEKFGCGLDGVLRHREFNLHGILNGADYSVWDPVNDPVLPATYSVDDISGKAICKKELIKEMNLDPALENRPILGFIGRLRGQKGIDLLIRLLNSLMSLDVGLVVLGEGKDEYERELVRQMNKYEGRLCAKIGYTEDLAHRIQAGSDIFLMPSRYEPCGLTQMYALRYGTPPVATAVGGLRDTITSWPAEDPTGFIFMNPTTSDFMDSIGRAIYTWENDKPAWRKMIHSAMSQAFTWEKSSLQYIELYRSMYRDYNERPINEYSFKKPPALH